MTSVTDVERAGVDFLLWRECSNRWGERLCGTVRKQLWWLLFSPQRYAAVGAKGHLR